MTEPADAPGRPAGGDGPDEAAPPPRADLAAAAAWIVVGAAIGVGAWRMDRLERLNINPYEAPGLVPGLLGVLLVILGVMLALRSLARLSGWSPQDAVLRSAGGGPAAAATGDGAPAGAARMALVFALTLGYALLLVGTGLPFWLGTFVFVTVFVGMLDRERQQALGRGRTAQWSRAAIYGAAWSAIVTLSFQHIFLVRLP